jgi:hypothetical protein
MNNKKFKLLILALKACLILIVAITLSSLIVGFNIGVHDTKLEETEVKRKLSVAKESVAVIPIKDSVIYENNDYSITGITSFQFQERKDSNHSNIFYLIEALKMFIAFAALFFLIKFIVKAFALLNRFEKFIILEKENLQLLNKAGINLFIFGIALNLFEIINLLFGLNWFHVVGYKINIWAVELDFSTIIIALIILTLSWILKFAIELKEENDLTV